MNRLFTGTKLPGIASVVAALGAAGLLLSTACAPAPAPVDTAALAAQLTQLDDAWSAAAATRNADSVASFYATDAVAYPPNMPVAVDSFPEGKSPFDVLNMAGNVLEWVDASYTAFEGFEWD